MTRIQKYLVSLPERVLRSASALSAGLVREIGEVVLPARLRRTKLYQTMVETTLRFLIATDPDLTCARLALVRAVALVIASGLAVFGVEPVEEM